VLRICLALALVTFAACAREPDRAVLSGASPLVGVMNAAADEADVPAEILAALAWSETALIAPTHNADADVGNDSHDGDVHVPRAFGVMGLPERGSTRTIARGAELLGVEVDAVKRDDTQNVRAAAIMLRTIADDLYGPGALGAGGTRDRWLAVVERYLGAGPEVAMDVRRIAARGLEGFDAQGRSLVIPSFAALWPDARTGTTRRGLNGEYPGSTFVAANSGNFTNDNRTAADIDVVVIHTVQGSYAGAISWFQDSAANVSAHYVVRRSDGAITQTVHHADIAWHAGNWSYNQRSIGIEHEGFVADANNYTPAMLQASADLTRWLCDNLGIPKDRSHIIGHVEVPGATHTDPGQFFPWDTYMGLVLNGMGLPPPPPAGTGTLQGVVYIGSDTSRRIPGATLTVSPGMNTTTARAGDGFWSFTLMPGMYTVTVAAPGYTTTTVSRPVVAGGEAWGSVGLAPQASMPGNGTLKGVVFDARTSDRSVRLPGAVVTLSNGATFTARAGDAYFEIPAPAGNYTVTVTKSGWQTATAMQTLVVGAETWGSMGIVPVSTMPVNRPPSIPVIEGPKDGRTARTPKPIFTVSSVDDPDHDALTLEIELFADELLTSRVSAGTLAVSAADHVVSWQHPIDDLTRGAHVFWRVRARDAALESAWSEVATFRVPSDAIIPGATIPWTAAILPGVGVNRAPQAPVITEPTDLAEVDTVRPRVSYDPPMDDEMDPLVYEIQIATDDVFAATEMTSGIVEGTAWVVTRDLAPGGTFYARARAADERVFGDWSAPVAFTISAQATGADRPMVNGDPGGDPVIDAKVIPTGSGCSALAGSDGVQAIAVIALALVLRTRRKR